MTKRFWNLISLFGTFGAGAAISLLAFAIEAKLGWLMLANFALITILANTYKAYRFKPRPDNPEGIRPPRPFDPRHVWRFLNPADAIAYFKYVDAGSMPSIHSARSFNQAALLAAYWISWPATIALLALAALVAWSRVVKRRHDRADITAGAICGLLSAAASAALFL
ncbi:MAG: phosphatase PAP2 family protein [Myxococcales bacterium]|nr:MAG: phosphatase PAP2 family protein [Myxococcales bacterium]